MSTRGPAFEAYRRQQFNEQFGVIPRLDVDTREAGRDTATTTTTTTTTTQEAGATT